MHSIIFHFSQFIPATWYDHLNIIVFTFKFQKSVEKITKKSRRNSNFLESWPTNTYGMPQDTTCLYWDDASKDTNNICFENITNRWPDGINDCVCVTRYVKERQIEGHIELLPTKTFGESGFPLRKNKSSYLTFNRMFCFVT